MHQHLVPFGVGTRQCGGQNLAQGVLRIVVAAVVRRFEPRADVRETNGRGMAMCDAFVSVSFGFAFGCMWILTLCGMQVLFPAAKECKLSFVPRAQ
jgi:hypothetical protein